MHPFKSLWQVIISLFLTAFQRINFLQSPKTWGINRPWNQMRYAFIFLKAHLLIDFWLLLISSTQRISAVDSFSVARNSWYQLTAKQQLLGASLSYLRFRKCWWRLVKELMNISVRVMVLGLSWKNGLLLLTDKNLKNTMNLLVTSLTSSFSSKTPHSSTLLLLHLSRTSCKSSSLILRSYPLLRFSV